MNSIRQEHKGGCAVGTVQMCQRLGHVLLSCPASPLAFTDAVNSATDSTALLLFILHDLVLVPNATTGLNAVISSCGLKPGDAAYSLDIG